jgi:hypothetical protein
VVLTGIVVAETPATMKTGGPGRPTSISLLLAEHLRRKKNNECCARISDEARKLQEWFHHNHSREPLPALGTIENRIRLEGFQRRDRTKL